MDESMVDYLLFPTVVDAKLRSVIWHKSSANRTQHVVVLDDVFFSSEHNFK